MAKSSSLLQRLSKIILRLMLWFFGISIFWVILLIFVNPPVTYLMIQRGFERKAEGKTWKLKKDWKDFEDISMNLKKAVLAAEDARFLIHHGFDFEAIEKAYQKNKKGKKIRGGSTISQQTAKNVFLWPGRSYIRKGFEAYFTLLIEIFWSKERILEVYLNVIETGDGIYGMEAATQTYYGKSCTSLLKGEAALLAAVLPNPRRWTPLKPTTYIYYKQGLILRNMRNLGKLKF
ncbi:monofunctional biosynthetic peptidoglycan transglycosylase [Pedobacter glucosidilyticus]|uniref:monofunctional biosynthetic peptidoglycan transglycosylase n=1 Tax=Pedobacter glucosidilyticus TaxID=1122941 RepID=UPI0026EB273F|nr:monofunctional biosynthetic peptidoglycan transglycosylase [Pedobacter glucosidilyticus]